MQKLLLLEKILKFLTNKTMRTKLLISFEGACVQKIALSTDHLSDELSDFMKERDLRVGELSLIRSVGNIFSLNATVHRDVENAILGHVSFLCEIKNDDDVENCNALEALFHRALGDL